jgi:HPt (histidine-containing phosphotransfer) domain-containing protein
MDQKTQHEMGAALDRLWAQFSPLMQERVAVLEEAAAAFGANQLSEAQQRAANVAAHKLAGSLGSFGLTRGTVLARELEITYSQENSADPGTSADLVKLTAQLRKLIEQRK